MNVKEYENVDTLDTKNIQEFFKYVFGNRLKEDHTIHGGFGTYTGSEDAPNKYTGLTFFDDNLFGEDCKDTIYLSKLAVCPAYQNNGISKKVLSYGLEMCKSKGYSIVYLRADKKKPHLEELYKKIANAEKIYENPKIHNPKNPKPMWDIYKIVLDESKAAEIDDSIYLAKVLNAKEDFYQKEIPFDYGGT